MSKQIAQKNLLIALLCFSALATIALLATTGIALALTGLISSW